MQENIARNTRFLASLLLGFLLLGGGIALVVAVASRFRSGVGVGVGIVAAACLVLGLLLAYWNAVDWLNLRAIRRTLSGGEWTLRRGAVVAFSGVVRTDAEPMTAPFSGTPCAAYAYVVATSRQSSSRGGSVRQVLAQGFHMTRTRIEGAARSLRLLSFPGFEDELRENVHGRKWAIQARLLIERISGRAPSAGQWERESRRLGASHAEVEEVHQDYCMGTFDGEGDGLVVDEEVLPVGREVCVVGAYDSEREGLTARRSRLGPNLMVYRGGAQEVVSRLGRETGGFGRTAAVLLSVGGLLAGIPFLPAAWTSALPIVGPAIVQPAPPLDEPGLAADAAHRQRIDGWVREEYLAGNASRALELAVDENAYVSLRWLIDRGVGPGTRMRVRGDWYQLPLVEAARLGHLETVRTLLQAGADPNEVQLAESAPETGRTALGESLTLSHCEIAALLMKSGARPPEGLEASRCP